MSRWFAKTLLKWNEPIELHRAAREANQQALGHWRNLGFAALLSAPFLILWALAQFNVALGAKNIHPPPWWGLLVIAGGAWVLAYLSDWLTEKETGPRIRITERGVLAQKGHFAWQVKFSRITRCELSFHQASDMNIPVFKLFTDQPRPQTFGVASSISLDELRRIFQAQGITVHDAREPPLYEEREVPVVLRRRLYFNTLLWLLLGFLLLNVAVFFAAIAGFGLCLLFGLNLDVDNVKLMAALVLLALTVLAVLLEYRRRSLTRLRTRLSRCLPTTVEEWLEKADHHAPPT